MHLISMTCDDLTSWLQREFGKGAYHARAIYKAVMGEGSTDYTRLPEFAKSGDLAQRIAARLLLPEVRIVETAEEEDAVKFVTELADGGRIESVILTMEHHETLCVSTQLGCRMGCGFCETAKLGRIRQLLPEEIVLQVFAARFILHRPIRNIVYMGMGEPLDNFDHLIRAIRILSDQRGLNIALRRQTVSTVGLVPGIDRLAEQNLRPLHLAVSLNAARDSLRSKLMPVNRKYPLAALKGALARYPLGPKGVILLAYVLIPGVNDTKEDVAALVDFCEGLSVRINLIPYNPGKNAQWEAPTDAMCHRFGDLLLSRGLFVRKRWSRGRDLMAGCGQLGGEGRGPA